MENAVNALKMGAAILVFIIAIASSFSLFGTAKQTADVIIAKNDKQAYLSAAVLDNGILYTSSESITGGKISGVTTNGDRVVGVDDVISTIYRYPIEKYSVTIIKGNEVIARYDTSLEGYINNYDNLGQAFFDTYKNNIEINISTDYCPDPKFKDGIESLYEIGHNNYIAPWLGNIENINKRINLDISGDTEVISGVEYRGKGLLEELKDTKIIEVVNEIDNSKYLENLLQQYEMPTVEIIYIVDNN